MKWMTLAVIAGLCVIFVVRVASAILPFVLRSTESTLPLALLDLLAGLAVALFFVPFYLHLSSSGRRAEAAEGDAHES